jgi:hypothetical protein
VESSNTSRWFPNQTQLAGPDTLERSFRQLLTMHYSLQDRFDALMQRQSAKTMQEQSGGGGGPVDTMIAGLRVQPVDTTTLANGATLKWDKASGTFKFS